MNGLTVASLSKDLIDVGGTISRRDRQVVPIEQSERSTAVPRSISAPQAASSAVHAIHAPSGSPSPSVEGRSVGMSRALPVQARSVMTIDRALDAAIELLATADGHRLRLSDVTERSGVSYGSLIHHFGSREGLIAAAQAIRHARDLDERLERSRSLGADDERLVVGIRELASNATTSQRDEQRRARFQALAFARHVPELREVLVAAHRGFAASLAGLVEGGQQRGLVRPGVAPRAVAAFANTSTGGRFVDDLLDDIRPAEEWRRLLTVLVGGILAPEVMARVATDASGASTMTAPHDAHDVVRASTGRERPAIPAFVVADEDEERVLSVAAAHRDRSGADAVRLGGVLAEAGVTRTWFTPRFGDRETLLDLVFLRRLVDLAHIETAALEDIFDAARSVEELLQRLATLVAGTTPEQIRQVAWDRLELLATAAARSGLRTEAAAIVAASTERVAAAIEGAQARDILRPDVSATLLARYFWAAPLTFLDATLSEVTAEELAQLSDLINAQLAAPAA